MRAFFISVFLIRAVFYSLFSIHSSIHLSPNLKSPNSPGTRETEALALPVLFYLEKLVEDALIYLSLSLSIPLSDFVVDVGGALWGHLLDDVNWMSVISADLLVVRAVVVLACAQRDDDVTRLRATMAGAFGRGQCAE